MNFSLVCNTKSYPKAILFGSLGVFGLILNSIVIYCLTFCNLNFPTFFLMRFQCATNIASLIIKTVNGVFVTVTGCGLPQHIPILTPLPGAALTWTMYCEYALQVCMAFNRLVVLAFQSSIHAEIWFSNSRVKLYGALCVMYGGVHGMMTMQPCCYGYFSPRLHSWTFIGSSPQWRQAATLVNDMVVYPLIICCYAFTVIGLRKSAEVSTISVTRLKREKRILAQFITVSGTWLTYSLFYRSVYFFPKLKFPGFSLVGEILRFGMFTIDPLVYIIFLQKLRNHIKNLARGHLPRQSELTHMMKTITKKSAFRINKVLPMNNMGIAGQNKRESGDIIKCASV